MDLQNSRPGFGFERRRCLRNLGASLLACAASVQVGAQEFPSGVMRLVVPYPAGTSLDQVARWLAESLSQRLGQTMIVENRPGASAAIGTDAVLRAKADGHTLLFAAGAIVVNPILMPRVGYDPFKDFEPLARVGAIPVALVSGAHVGAATLEEFLRAARTSSRKLSYSTFGIGSVAHLYFELLQQATGIEMVHVPYKGEAAMVGDVAGGQVDITIATGPQARAMAAAGKLRPLAVIGEQRLPDLPDVPTLGERGIAIDNMGWFGVVAPAGLAPGVAARLAQALRSAMAERSFGERLQVLGLGPLPGGPAEMAAQMRALHERVSQLVKTRAIKLE